MIYNKYKIYITIDYNMSFMNFWKYNKVINDARILSTSGYGEAITVTSCKFVNSGKSG